MFSEQKDVNFAAYADDKTPYFFEKNFEVLLSKLQIWALKLLEWFWSNFIEMNSDKYHLIPFPSYKVHVYKSSTTINENFYNVSIQLLSTHLECHSRNINNQINKLHECTLRLVYSDKSSSFRELLETDKSVTIHKRTLLFGNFLKQISQSLFIKELFFSGTFWNR